MGRRQWLLFTETGYNSRILLNDRELVGGYLMSVLENKSFAMVSRNIARNYPGPVSLATRLIKLCLYDWLVLSAQGIFKAGLCFFILTLSALSIRAISRWVIVSFMKFPVYNPTSLPCLVLTLHLFHVCFSFLGCLLLFLGSQFPSTGWRELLLVGLSDEVLRCGGRGPLHRLMIRSGAFGSLCGVAGVRWLPPQGSISDDPQQVLRGSRLGAGQLAPPEGHPFKEE